MIKISILFFLLALPLIAGQSCPQPFDEIQDITEILDSIDSPEKLYSFLDKRINPQIAGRFFDYYFQNEESTNFIVSKRVNTAYTMYRLYVFKLGRNRI